MIILQLKASELINKNKVLNLHIFSSMLRVGEALKLKLSDFNSQRTLIHTKEVKSIITEPDFSIVPIWKNN